MRYFFVKILTMERLRLMHAWLIKFYQETDIMNERDQDLTSGY